MERTFGFETAVAKAQDAIIAAHEEARSARNGIGIVKLMGRESGFIALHASLASGDVNMVLLPEMDFDFESVLK
jgi:6-phosphofructokinase 1